MRGKTHTDARGRALNAHVRCALKVRCPITLKGSRVCRMWGMESLTLNMPRWRRLHICHSHHIRTITKRIDVRRQKPMVLMCQGDGGVALQAWRARKPGTPQSVCLLLQYLWDP